MSSGPTHRCTICKHSTGGSCGACGCRDHECLLVPIAPGAPHVNWQMVPALSRAEVVALMEEAPHMIGPHGTLDGRLRIMDAAFEAAMLAITRYLEDGYLVAAEHLREHFGVHQVYTRGEEG